MRKEGPLPKPLLSPLPMEVKALELNPCPWQDSTARAPVSDQQGTVEIVALFFFLLFQVAELALHGRFEPFGHVIQFRVLPGTGGGHLHRPRVPGRNGLPKRRT